MFSLAYNLIAQDNNVVLNSLQADDNKLQDLNNQLDVVKNDYVNLVGRYDTYSFFNFNNIYFWFLILGLILLLFGLIYLLSELKHSNNETVESEEPAVDEEPVTMMEKMPKSIIEEPGKAARVSPIRDQSGSNEVNSKKEKIVDSIRSQASNEASITEKKKGPVKIKVIKVK